MGLGMAAVWTRDIVVGARFDRADGRFRAREPGSGTLLLPHWIAEYATAGALVAGGVGLLADRTWGRAVALLSVGALLYTSVDSLGWALATDDRRPYAIPMTVGAVGGTVVAVLLLVP
jgi:hypothetical protein